MNDDLRDAVRRLEHELRQLRDWAARLFARFPTTTAGPGLGFDRCKCLAVGAFTEADTQITVDNVVAERGESPLADPDSTTETLIVLNRYGYGGADNDLMTIVFDQSVDPDVTPSWYLLQKGC